MTFHKMEQECIPVGCVPAARRPYAGVCFLGGGGLPGPGGGSAWSRGVSLVQGGLPGPGGSPWSRWVCLVWGGSAWLGGGVLRGGWHPSMHWGRHPPHLPCGQTDTCKSITLATTSLRPVINRKVKQIMCEVLSCYHSARVLRSPNVLTWVPPVTTHTHIHTHAHTTWPWPP